MNVYFWAICILFICFGLFFFFIYKKKRKKDVNDMPVGIQVYREDGSIALDGTGTHKYMQAIGTIYVPPANGAGMNITPSVGMHSDSRIKANPSRGFAFIIGTPVDARGVVTAKHGYVYIDDNGDIRWMNYSSTVLTIIYGVY